MSRHPRRRTGLIAAVVLGAVVIDCRARRNADGTWYLSSVETK